jgi:hypothetical protein
LVEAFPEDAAPRWLLRDRDSIYDDQVRRRIASLGITEVVSSPLDNASGKNVRASDASID